MRHPGHHLGPKLVPAEGFEPPTSRLRSGCSTAELRRLKRATDIGVSLQWQAIVGLAAKGR